MALPVSQYSVLDARRIERVADDTFVCYVDGVTFLGARVDPVVVVHVAAGGRGPTVSLLEARLEGSAAAVRASERFDVTMTNRVRWGEVGGDERGRGGGGGDDNAPPRPASRASASTATPPTILHLSSDITIEVRIEVPRWFALPTAVVERAASALAQRVLDVAVPRFLAQLAGDYEKWAAGEDRL
jgi:hypothetical protein